MTVLAIANDHCILREGLARLLSAQPDFEVAIDVASGPELIFALRSVRVDVVITDLSMPSLAPMDLVRRLRAENPHLPLLVLTMHSDEQYAIRAFKAGANGYLTKDAGIEQLIVAIRKLASGGNYVTSSQATYLIDALRKPREDSPHDALTNRELEIYRFVVAGHRLTDIANALNLSIKTVSTHKANIMEKLGVSSTACLVRYGVQHRLFDQDGQVINPTD